MTYVIAQSCCNDSSCVAVCPVQCIRPRPGDPQFSHTEQLYIDPETCIDCGACMDACPVDAVYPEWEVPDELSDLLALNADYFVTNPMESTGAPSTTRRVLPDGQGELRVAIVGTGPAACYAAGTLSEIAGVQVTMLERLPTPFGLVRAGVAPDHARTKKIGDYFAGILSRRNVSCYFNVEVGRDVSIDELLQHHHAVLWAGGARDDRRLGIEGEDLPGVHSARSFVGWYNGHPDHADAEFDLSGERVVLIGNGNVALDVARTLLRPAEVFRSTDMADHAIDALAASAVTEVVVAARRGPEHASYSLGELMGLERTDDVTVAALPGEIGEHPGDPRHEVLVRAAANNVAEGRVVRFRFGMEPVAIEGGERVAAVRFRRSDGTEETVPTSLVLRAVGYRGTAIDGLPFDDQTATLPNDAGKVVDPDTGLDVPGLYCAGWIKRGPRGIIGTNRHDAEETVDCLLSDFAAGRLTDPSGSDLGALLLERVPELLDKQGWARIDAEEKRRGRAESRPRRKFVTVAELLAASHTDA